jgi:hypothetical protein
LDLVCKLAWSVNYGSEPLEVIEARCGDRRSNNGKTGGYVIEYFQLHTGTMLQWGESENRLLQYRLDISYRSCEMHSRQPPGHTRGVSPYDLELQVAVRKNSRKPRREQVFKRTTIRLVIEVAKEAQPARPLIAS